MDNNDNFNPAQLQEVPDEFNPHSPNFYQNAGGSDGGYVNDPFSAGYTGGNGPAEFSQSDGFQGFQGYYDNSGFENYKDYKGPNPYYRGYYGNSGFNPSQNNPAAYPGGMTPPSQGFTPDYDRLRENADSFYYKGYQSGAAKDGGGSPGSTEDYSMSFARFSSISHLWSAVALVLTFCGAYLLSLFYRPFEQSKELVTTNTTIAAGCFIAFLILGTVAFKIASKTKKKGASVILLIFSFIAGAALMPGIMMLMGANSGMAVFGFLVCAALIGILAIIGLLTKQNLTKMSIILLLTAVAGMLFYALSFNFPLDSGQITTIIISTGLLMVYAAVETYSVKRTYDEFICDDEAMSRNAAIAALGHYISLIMFVMNTLGSSSTGTASYAGRQSRYSGRYTSPGEADIKFAESFKIDQSEIWK